MLRKHLHETYMVSLSQFLDNYEYLLSVNDKAQKTITLQQGKMLAGMVLTPNTLAKLNDEIEKLEANYQANQSKLKELKKENETLKARCELLERLNNADNKDIPF